MLLKLCNTNLGSLGSFIAELQYNFHLDSLVEYLNPVLFITMTNKDDNLNFTEAFMGPDIADFLLAMRKEYTTTLDEI